MTSTMFLRLTTAAVACVAWAILGGGLSPAIAVEYVDAGATGGNTGADWANAYTSLDSALNTGTDDEIWVAEGTYTPASTFALKNHDVYGGFLGNEADRGSRNPSAHPTILQANGTNRILRKASATGLAVVDGFTLRGGALAIGANGACVSSEDGTLTLSNCVLTNNAAGAGGVGGAVYLPNTGPDGPLTISNCVFRGNLAPGGGGDVYVGTLAQAVTIRGCSFISSVASNRGGALYLLHTKGFTMTDCTFSNVTSLGSGGAVYRQCNAVITNTLRRVTFRDVNIRAGSGGDYAGGALYLWCGAGGKHVVADCSFVRTANLRTDQAYGGAIYVARGAVELAGCTITNATLRGNTANGGAVCIRGTEADPVLVSNCVFRATTNGTSGLGGAVYVENRSAPVTVVDSTFQACSSARHGGALYLLGHASHTVRVERCSFFANRVTAATYDGGALYLGTGTNGSRVVNCVFARNSAADGGGAVCDAGLANARYLHCTFYTNTAMYGGGLRKDAGAAAITNTIFWQNSAAMAGHQEVSADPAATVRLDCCNGDTNRMSGLDAATRMKNANPKFLDPEVLDLRIPVTSPMKDAGIALADVPVDRDGLRRKGLPDIGAYRETLPDATILLIL